MPRRRRPLLGQQPLPLAEPPPPATAAISAARPEPARYCERPVAGLLHRALATLLDTSIVLIGVALLVVTFHFCGGAFDLSDRLSQIALGVTTASLFAFYRILALLWGQDSPGMVWTRLRLVNFDGLPPTRRQRLWRLAGVLLCFASAGFGFIWALTDQERLGWHDHISRTFPSPRVG